jgi:hypothetical protein
MRLGKYDIASDKIRDNDYTSEAKQFKIAYSSWKFCFVQAATLVFIDKNSHLTIQA